MSNPSSAAALRGTISLGVPEKKKDGIVGVKRKWWVLAQLPYYSKETGAVTQGGTRGLDHLMWRRTQGADIVKGWEDKRDLRCIPDTFT